MKLYKTIAPGKPPVWSSSSSQAGSDRAALIKEGFKRTEVRTETIEVAGGKAGLLAFLNSPAAR